VAEKPVDMRTQPTVTSLTFLDRPDSTRRLEKEKRYKSFPEGDVSPWTR
jgi:hypothetical protein